MSKTQKRKRRPRKPARLGMVMLWEVRRTIVEAHGRYGVFCFDAKDCRKLGKWLIRATDYLEAKEAK